MIMFVFYIGLFFALTGAYAIIRSLQSLGEHRSDSALKTSWFEMKAPSGFVYGIVAILIVLWLIKYGNTLAGHVRDTDDRYEKNLGTYEDGITNVKIYNNKPTSILGGRVLIECDHDSLLFSGIHGLSTDLDQRFRGKSILLSKGGKFYFMIHDSTIWGVNVIDSGWQSCDLEVYKESIK